MYDFLFYNRQASQNNMNDDIVLRLDHALNEYDLGLEILLIGVDNTGHIYTTLVILAYLINSTVWDFVV